MTPPSDKTIWQELRAHLWILGGLLTLLWIIQGVNAIGFDGKLVLLGIRPRQLEGLPGILWAPFLHASYGHLMANTIPLILLGWLIMLQETGDFWIVTVIVMAVSGGGTWLVGSPLSVHVGASGLIFGYLGYLLLRGYFERSATAIALACVVMGLYGSFIWGILPFQAGISWEGHLFGWLGGGIAARLLAQPPAKS